MEPQLSLFLERPANWKHEFVASSMQSLETSLYLIGLGRYPHALVNCASAIESVLHSAGVGTEDDGFYQLLKKAKPSIRNLELFDHRAIEEFYDFRNEVVHKVFIPADSDHSIKLLIAVGWPILGVIF